MQIISHEVDLYIAALGNTLRTGVDLRYVPAEPSTGFEEQWSLEAIYDVDGKEISDILMMWRSVESQLQTIVADFLNSKRGVILLRKIRSL